MRTVDFIRNNDFFSNQVGSKTDNYSDADSMLVNNPVKSMFTSTKGPDFGDIGSSISDIWDHFLHGNTNDINKANFELQKQNLEYQKALQERIFQREDSAYQRMVSDVRNAGLSPLGLNGSQAGEAIQTSAPNQNKLSTGMMSAISNLLGTILNFKSSVADINNKNAQTNFINSQAQKVNNENSLFNYDLDSEWKKYRFLNDYQNYNSKIYDNLDKEAQYKFNKIMGWTSNTPEWLKTVSFVSNIPLLRIFGDTPNNSPFKSFNEDILLNGSNSVYDYDSVVPKLIDNVQSLGEELFNGAGGLMKSLIQNLFGSVFGFSNDDMLDYAIKDLGFRSYYSRKFS